MIVSYTRSHTITDLQEILILQDKNLKTSLAEEVTNTQGFVTEVHDLSLLQEMNEAEKHVIAKSK